MSEPVAASALRHMPDRVSVLGIVMGGLIVSAGIAASLVAAFVLVHADERGTPPPIAPPISSVAGTVVLQAAPERDIAAFRAEKQRLLDQYAWVDRDRGIARIPIAEAMELLARSGDAAARETQR